MTLPHANNEAGELGMEAPDYGDYADRDWPEPQKGYAAMVARIDADVGRLLDLLKELGIDEQTLVIFTSDNGSPRGEAFDPDFFDANGPLRGYKGDVTEAGIRVPLIARWPGRIAAGTTSETPIYFADVMPTFAALCGGKAPEGIDGLDFSPTLLGSNQPELSDRFFYWEFDKAGVQQQGARWRHWKAVRNPKKDSMEIYDLAADVGETRDLSGACPELVDKFADFFRTARSESPYWPMSAADVKAPAANAPSPVPSS